MKPNKMDKIYLKDKKKISQVWDLLFSEDPLVIWLSRDYFCVQSHESSSTSRSKGMNFLSLINRIKFIKYCFPVLIWLNRSLNNFATEFDLWPRYSEPFQLKSIFWGLMLFICQGFLNFKKASTNFKDFCLLSYFIRSNLISSNPDLTHIKSFSSPINPLHLNLYHSCLWTLLESPMAIIMVVLKRNISINLRLITIF